MSEQLANNASSTLNGAITSSQTTLVLTSAAGFPTSGNFRIIVGTELMLVTAVASNTFTVTRGIESTANAAHASGVTVAHILTAAGLAQFVADNSSAAPSPFGSSPCRC